ncbi:MAG: capsule assembly Wzi family protein [Gemmatimonadota bacterium]
MRLTRRLALVQMVLALGGAALTGGTAAAQEVRGVSAGSAPGMVGSEWEEYLRFLQTLGAAPAYPWSVRAFSPAEVDRILPADSLHPWSAEQPRDGGDSSGLRVRWIAPQVDVIHNTAFPYSVNDGPLWAGKGLTTAVQGGVALRYGPLSLTLAPVAFRAENARFPLAESARPGADPFEDPMGVGIDLPQRFGDEAYARLDPGQSTVRLDFPAVTLGASTANQQWGPGSTHPLLLGNNAPGFTHVFVGTGKPLGIGIGSLHARALAGQLEESDYSPAADTLSRRLMSGVVVVFVPRGLPTLELGGARLIQSGRFRRAVRQHFSEMLGGLFKSQATDPDDAREQGRLDQRASFFGRWVAPGSGLEFYGEYAREDHNWDLRDFLLEPDHTAGYMVGVRKAWSLADTRMLTFRGEAVNTQSSHLRPIRSQGIFYAGSGVPQGHTHGGQVLGSVAAFGGSGLVAASDFYHPGGRWSASYTRTYLHGPGNSAVATEPDVLQTLGADALFMRPRWDVRVGVDAMFRDDPRRPDESFNLRSFVRFALKF